LPHFHVSISQGFNGLDASIFSCAQAMELAEEERREYDDMAEGLRLQLLGLPLIKSKNGRSHGRLSHSNLSRQFTRHLRIEKEHMNFGRLGL
jgi:hypothetical protein